VLHAKRYRTTIEREYKITVSILNGFLIFSIIQAFIFAGLFWVMPVEKVAVQILKALKSKKKGCLCYQTMATACRNIKTNPANNL